MTEQVNVSESAQNQNSQPAVSQNSSAQVSQPAEKLLRQSEVNELVGSVKNSSYEKGKQDALAEWQKQQTVSQPNTQAPTVTAASLPQITPEIRAELRKEVVADVQQDLQRQQFVNQLALKLSSGQQKYSDFDKIVTPLQLQNIPDVVHLANGFDNTADIMYDLGKTPSKVANLTILAKINPQLAYAEMQALSDSIKKNETAIANHKDVREPLSQQKSSNVGEDNGSRTIADIRRDKRYRV